METEDNAEIRINRNIVECKETNLQLFEDNIGRINRNIVECKVILNQKCRYYSEVY